METKQGADILGARYQQVDLYGGTVTLMLLLHDEEALLEPGFAEAVRLAAILAAQEIRSQRLNER